MAYQRMRATVPKPIRGAQAESSGEMTWWEPRNWEMKPTP